MELGKLTNEALSRFNDGENAKKRIREFKRQEKAEQKTTETRRWIIGVVIGIVGIIIAILSFLLI